MKKCCIILLLSWFIPGLYAQNWEWAIQENVKNFAVDFSGNIFTYNDSAVKCYTPSGKLIWQKALKGNVSIRGIAADSSGNLYLMGIFSDFTIGVNQFISGNFRDIFFMKFNSEGTLLWSRVLGNIGYEVTDIYITPQQKIIICGNTEIEAIVRENNADASSFFVAVYDTEGNRELLFSNSGGTAWEISADPKGNIYLLGKINQTQTLDFGNGTIFPGCGSDCEGEHFIAKYDPSGKIQWAKNMGGNYYLPFVNLAVDSKGNFYLSKWRRYDGFILGGFDGSGNLKWTRGISGTYGNCNALCVGSNDIIWLAGSISNDPFINLPIVWKFESSGEPGYTMTAKGAAEGLHIANDGRNNIYVSGTLWDSAVFGATTLYASQGNHFLAKLHQDPLPVTTVNDRILENETIHVFPNPGTGTIQVQFPEDKRMDKSIAVYDAAGRCVYNNPAITGSHTFVDLNKEASGVYIIEVLCGGGKWSERIVLH